MQYRILRRAAAALTLIASTAMLGGCAVAMVTGAVVGVASTGVGLVTDAAVGTVKLTGKAVGAAADLVIPTSSK